MPRKSKTKLQPLPLSSKEPIGKRIARIRKEKGYTQQQLADKIGIIRNLVTDYEIGKLRLYDEMVSRFALALGVSADEILGLKPLKSSMGQYSLKLVRRIKKIAELSPKLQKDALHNIDLLLSALEKHKKVS